MRHELLHPYPVMTGKCSHLRGSGEVRRQVAYVVEPSALIVVFELAAREEVVKLPGDVYSTDIVGFGAGQMSRRRAAWQIGAASSVSALSDELAAELCARDARDQSSD